MSKDTCQHCTGIDITELTTKAFKHDLAVNSEKTLAAQIQVGDFLIKVLRESYSPEVNKEAQEKLLKIIKDL